MKVRTIYALVLFLLFFCVQDVSARKPVTVTVKKGDARVTFIDGSAEIMIAGTTIWDALKIGNHLADGDHIRTGPASRMEIVLPDDSILRFADNTRFRIKKLDVCSEEQKRDVKIDVVLGKTWANVSKSLGITSNFELSSDNAVAGVRGTIYRMNVYDDKSALVRVYDGKVAVSGGGTSKAEKGQQQIYTKPHKVEGPKPIPGPVKVTMQEWVYIIKSMQQIRIRADGVAEKPSDFTEKEDRNDWVDWNKERDLLRIRY
jgi:ferric-dicitrate binding protein FerR (iron transport regulator)